MDRRRIGRRGVLCVLVAAMLAACAEPPPSPPVTPTQPASASPARPNPTPAPTEAPSTPKPAPTESPSKPTPAPSAGPSLAQLVGQKLFVAMNGKTPSAALLGRIRRGEVGGVILFGANIASRAQLRRLTRTLHEAAAAGGQPPLLIATDQEGGSVRRITWAPPTLSAPAMGADRRTATARAQGAATGTALAALGIDMNFAPVVDVPTAGGSFMRDQGRTWSSDAARTARLAVAFGSGMRDAGVLPVFKHFPGIGRAARNTDLFVVTLRGTAAAFSPGLLPYRAAVDAKMPAIMLSNATYPAWDARNAAGWSPAIVSTLLRKTLKFRGVTVTDSLSGTASARGMAAWRLAVRAAKAGTDLVMVTGDEASTQRAYERLLAAAQSGSIPRATLEASYRRIIALKEGR